jgi:serine/threonine protein kinase
MTPVGKGGQEVRAPVAAGIVNPIDPAESAALGNFHVSKGHETAEPLSLSSDADSAFIDLVFVEYCKRLKSGEKPDVEELCSRYPAYRDELQRLFYAERLVGDELEEFFEPRTNKEQIPWPREGERRGDFKIVRELGRGSFARVYLATESSTGDRLVVVKFSASGNTEARILGRLAHPHVVPILSARQEEATGLTVVCMPYLGSATLEDVLRHLRIAPPASRPENASCILDVLRVCAQPEDKTAPAPAARLRNGTYIDGVIHLVVQLAQTLSYVHRQDVLHRDLKPSNVLLDHSGKPLLLDFNLSVSAWQTCPAGGTLHYMAPEQLSAFVDDRAEGVEERVDLFSLAVIVYELLASEHPCGPLPSQLQGKPLAEFLLARIKAGFPPFRRISRELERPVAAILDRCLAFDAAERPSAKELAATLKRQFTPVRQIRRRMFARPRLTLSLLGLFLSAFILGAFVWSAASPYSEREYRRGLQAYRQGDFDVAEMHFDRAFKAGANQSPYRFARGCARLQQSKLRPPDSDRIVWTQFALLKLKQIVEDLTPEEQGGASPSTLAVHAYVQIRRQFPEEAILMYTQILADGYRPVMALNNRAYCYMVVRQLEKAEEDLRQAALLDPHCQAVFYSRAMLAVSKYLRERNHLIPQQAFEDMEHAIRLGPVTPLLLFDAAYLYAQAAYADARRIQVSLDAPLATALALRARNERMDRAIYYLRRAIAAGQRVNLDDKKTIIYRALNSHPHFPALRWIEPRDVLPWRELRLIDPVELSEA